MKSYTFEYIVFVLFIALLAGVFAWLGSVDLWLALGVLVTFAVVIITFLLGRKFGRVEMVTTIKEQVLGYKKKTDSAGKH